MRSTRFLHPRCAPALLLAVLAACGGDGGAEPVARLHELRLAVAEGQGIRDTVRAPGDPADARTSRPVVVRVWVDAQRSAQVLPGATGPALESRIPPVEIAWRTLEPWCQPEGPRSTLTGGTAHMHLRLPTVAQKCHLVAEGMLNGNVFGTDTAVVDFHPGPLATFQLAPLVIIPENFSQDVRAIGHEGKDVHGNAVTDPGFAWALTGGAPLFTLNGYLLRGAGQGIGQLQATGAGSTQTATVWTLHTLTGGWRISWGCYGARLADGAHADSARYLLYPAEASYGSITGRGVTLGFRGTLTVRTWVRGGAVRDSTALAATRSAAQRPNLLEWSPGQVAAYTATGTYTGGSLCEAPPSGTPWAGFAPVRAEQV